MSDFSLTLVLHFKTSKIINDMAKVQIKSEKITPFGGIFHVRDQFSRFVGPVINKVLGLRCTSYDYQYNEIVGSRSSDTILRGISELATGNTTYTSDTGKSYDFNTAAKLRTPCSCC